MINQDIIDRITEVLRDTFDDDELSYADELTAADVEGWDSLSNIRFMVAIEQEFSFKLTIADWQSLASLGDLARLVAARQ
jgi:acyl carrier protein